jgi:hypothetical protein
MSGDGEDVKVYLRFRPMDKLETSKRSKDCIHLHDNPKIVTVDSPLQGVYDFSFDAVRSYVAFYGKIQDHSDIVLIFFIYRLRPF